MSNFIVWDNVEVTKSTPNRKRWEKGVVKEEKMWQYLISFTKPDKYWKYDTLLVWSVLQLIEKNSVKATKISDSISDKMWMVVWLIWKLNDVCKRANYNIEWNYFWDMKSVFKIISSLVNAEEEDENAFNMWIIYNISNIKNDNVKIATINSWSKVKYQITLLDKFFEK